MHTYIHTYTIFLIYVYVTIVSTGYIGYREANVNQKKRIVENVKLTKDRNDSLDALEIKMRKGSYF